jgi:hypothetical protein
MFLHDILVSNELGRCRKLAETVKAFDLYLGDVRLESLPGPTVLTDVFRGFPQSPQINTRIVP